MIDTNYELFFYFYPINQTKIIPITETLLQKLTQLIPSQRLKLRTFSQRN